ncbi:MAG: sulfatase-like hydrolase/transferase, partial [Phycisphaerae bacterium]|nr:sulfatase-like hydrolase/transferase [Phycisphaerae bacterium]
IYRNNEIIDDTGYLTDNLAREAVSFVERHRAEPFFLYLPFNAVHWPLQAPKKDIDRFDTGEKNRDIYLAMLKRMDEGIGKVLDALKRTGVDEETLVFFFSDNGGARKNYANNGKLRDFKQSVYEGGIRVPFIVRWPGRLRAGSVCDQPTICLDIMPTICAAVGAELPKGRVYDGKNMLPALSGNRGAPLHEALFWDGGVSQWGVRAGKWKLLTNRQGLLELYNLEEDLSEKNNVIENHRDIARRLGRLYSQWKSTMAPKLVKPGRDAKPDKARKRNK